MRYMQGEYQNINLWISLVLHLLFLIPLKSFLGDSPVHRHRSWGMWGQISNFVGKETLENIKDTVSNITQDLGSLDDADDLDYEDRNAEELAAQSIEVS